jgi:hypothetical protein
VDLRRPVEFRDDVVLVWNETALQTIKEERAQGES